MTEKKVQFKWNGKKYQIPGPVKKHQFIILPNNKVVLVLSLSDEETPKIRTIEEIRLAKVYENDTPEKVAQKVRGIIAEAIN